MSAPMRALALFLLLACEVPARGGWRALDARHSRLAEMSPGVSVGSRQSENIDNMEKHLGCHRCLLSLEEQEQEQEQD